MASKILNALSKGASFARSALFDRRLPVAYVGGWLGKHNLGDEALLEAYRFLFPSINFAHFDGGRIATQMVRRLPGLKAGMLGGGTLIGQEEVWLDIPRRFLELRPRLVVFGTGVEEPSFWGGTGRLDAWKPLLERCQYIGVRGPRSAELLAEVGFPGIEVVGDPVLAFAEKDIVRTHAPNSIGLNIGTSDGNVWGYETRIRDEVAALAKTAREAGWKVEWFVVWPKDMELTRQAALASGTAQHIHVICEDHRRFIRQARELTAFVGMKLHATVLATCALTPSIMLEYRPKCRDYMQSIGQDRFTFKTDSLRAGEIWEIVREWGRDRLSAAASLAEAIHSRQEKQRAAAERVTGLLKTF
jgi:polysaccharide pyruvyl transferase WcaK-like protein